MLDVGGQASQGATPPDGDLRPSLSARLRDLRTSRGWSQAELAARIGLSNEAYGRIERGHVLPRIQTLVHFAQETGTSLDALLIAQERKADGGAEARRAQLVEALVAGVQHLSERELEVVLRVAELCAGWRRHPRDGA